MKTMTFSIQLHIPTGPNERYSLAVLGQSDGEAALELAVAELTGYPVYGGTRWGAERGVVLGRDGVHSLPETEIALTMLEGAIK